MCHLYVPSRARHTHKSCNVHNAGFGWVGFTLSFVNKYLTTSTRPLSAATDRGVNRNLIIYDFTNIKTHTSRWEDDGTEQRGFFVHAPANHMCDHQHVIKMSAWVHITVNKHRSKPDLSESDSLLPSANIWTHWCGLPGRQLEKQSNQPWWHMIW